MKNNHKKGNVGIISVIILVLAMFFPSAEKYLSVFLYPDTAVESTVESSAVRSQIQGFRNARLREEHYEKHGVEMGFASAEDYEQAAVRVVNDPKALHKLEKEDNDDIYYLEKTNEFVIVSTDGYLRTYFNPDGGISYFNRQ